ncbi:hypothetical protein RCIA27 [Methanocella arvoryzae MRE50]|uniref:Uncharacterized protein n=1 Tax=Methanocella arvoryzae (strain DSM 22066 / NBRC 105507 / MRE50) TaxID=351160 RepID=Q0W6G2_METAR|nr:hypothetical protein RCIA27 [Methanocella arvoryzae MRE50]
MLARKGITRHDCGVQSTFFYILNAYSEAFCPRLPGHGEIARRTLCVSGCSCVVRQQDERCAVQNLTDFTD